MKLSSDELELLRSAVGGRAVIDSSDLERINLLRKKHPGLLLVWIAGSQDRVSTLTKGKHQLKKNEKDQLSRIHLQ